MPRSQTPQPGSVNPKLLVNRREAAEMLAISERTLWSLTANGELPSIKIRKAVRYSVGDLQRYIDAQRVA
ncbi:MAG TPA: DNA-binding protein [Planctomycetaceae bacterium]|nr:DNA-binding protein [Planctomycetaceae bacterium]